MIGLIIGRSGEIRTHGPFRAVCFQDRCNKPDSATLRLFGTPRRIRTDTILLLRETPHTNWARGALFGAPSRIRTYGFADLQSTALGHSATGA